MTMARLRTAVLLAGMLAIFAGIADARDIGFTLRLKDNRPAPGRQTYLEMVFPDALDVPAPEVSFIKGVSITYDRWNLGKALVGGQEVPALIYTYKIAGLRKGSYAIGPITFEYKGNIYRSNAVVMDVGAPPPAGEAAPSGVHAVGISKRIYLVLEVPKTTVFVNERVPIALKFYSDWFNIDNMAEGAIKGDNIIIDDSVTKDSKVIEKDGVNYMMIQRPAAFTAPAAGRFTIKPVTVTVDAVIYDKDDLRSKLNTLNDNVAFYEEFVGPSKKRTIELSTEAVDIIAVPLPTEGRPEDFTGAVGDFSFDLSASAAEVRLGGEITLTMTIKGPGNYSSVSLPRMRKEAGIKLYEPRVIRGGNSVIYEQVIRVQSPDVKEIPEAVFTFFNPVGKRYISTRKGPLKISVTAPGPGETAMAEKAKEKAKEKAEEKKGWVDGLKEVSSDLRRRDIPLYRKRSFLPFETLPLLIALAGACVYAVMRYLQRHPLYAASFAASRKAREGIIRAQSMISRGSPQEFYNLLFRILQDYLGTRRLKPSEGVTSRIIDEIDTSGIGQDVIDRIRKVFYECYIAKYTQGSFGPDDMRNTLDAVTYIVENLNRRAEL